MKDLDVTLADPEDLGLTVLTASRCASPPCAPASHARDPFAARAGQHGEAMDQTPAAFDRSRYALIHLPRKMLAVLEARGLRVLLAAVPKVRSAILAFNLGTPREPSFLAVHCLQCGAPSWIEAGEAAELDAWARCPHGCEPRRIES